jgi:hypothetical protein
MPEVYGNSAYSTLASGITAGATSLTVAAGHGARFPATGNFRLRIDSEILICTSRSVDVLTVTRTAEGTAAASHDAGAAVNHVLTAAGLLALPLASLTDVYTAWTPASVLQPGSVAFTTIVARYCKVGKTIHAYARIDPSAAGTAGNDITVTLPAALTSFQAGTTLAVGSAVLFDNGTRFYPCIPVMETTTTIKFRDPAAGGLHGTTPSWALASGDALTFSITYEALT